MPYIPPEVLALIAWFADGSALETLLEFPLIRAHLRDRLEIVSNFNNSLRRFNYAELRRFHFTSFKLGGHDKITLFEIDIDSWMKRSYWDVLKKSRGLLFVYNSGKDPYFDLNDQKKASQGILNILDARSKGLGYKSVLVNGKFVENRYKQKVEGNTNSILDQFYGNENNKKRSEIMSKFINVQPSIYFVSSYKTLLNATFEKYVDFEILSRIKFDTLVLRYPQESYKELNNDSINTLIMTSPRAEVFNEISPLTFEGLKHIYTMRETDVDVMKFSDEPSEALELQNINFYHLKTAKFDNFRLISNCYFYQLCSMYITPGGNFYHDTPLIKNVRAPKLKHLTIECGEPSAKTALISHFYAPQLRKLTLVNYWSESVDADHYNVIGITPEEVYLKNMSTYILKESLFANVVKLRIETEDPQDRIVFERLENDLKYQFHRLKDLEVILNDDIHCVVPKLKAANLERLNFSTYHTDEKQLVECISKLYSHLLKFELTLAYPFMLFLTPITLSNLKTLIITQHSTDRVIEFTPDCFKWKLQSLETLVYVLTDPIMKKLNLLFNLYAFSELKQFKLSINTGIEPSQRDFNNYHRVQILNIKTLSVLEVSGISHISINEDTGKDLELLLLLKGNLAAYIGGSLPKLKMLHYVYDAAVSIPKDDVMQITDFDDGCLLIDSKDPPLNVQEKYLKLLGNIK